MPLLELENPAVGRTFAFIGTKIQDLELTSPTGREWYAKYHDSAVAVPSPAVDSISKAAKSHRVYIQVGIIEKDGGTLYCTALLVSRDGSVLLKHRKVSLTAQLESSGKS